MSKCMKSSSGRRIVTPKNLLPTSSDEEPPKKKKTIIEEINLKTRKAELRAILHNLKSESERTTPSSILFSNKHLKCNEFALRGLENETDQFEEVSSEQEGQIIKSQDCPLTLLDKSTLIERMDALNDKLTNLTELAVEQHNETMHDIKILSQANTQLAVSLNKLTTQLEELTKSHKKAEVDQSFMEHLQGFPLKRREEFEMLEENKDEREKLMKHLQKIGAGELRDFIKISFKEIFCDQLVNEHITWKGLQDTIDFGNSKMANIIFCAAKECSFFRGPETKNEFKIEVTDILRITKQRAINCRKRQAVVTDPERLKVIQDLEDKLQRLEEDC